MPGTQNNFKVMFIANVRVKDKIRVRLPTEYSNSGGDGPVFPSEIASLVCLETGFNRPRCYIHLMMGW